MPTNNPKPSPITPEALTIVYEVYGSSARSHGWDFLVCKTAKEALHIIESDIDELDTDPDEEDVVKIVCRKYTKEQMEEVAYE